MVVGGKVVVVVLLEVVVGMFPSKSPFKTSAVGAPAFVVFTSSTRRYQPKLC